MHVVVLGLRGFPNVQGGVEKHCEELFPRLVRLGVRATVFTRSPYVPPGRRIWKGVELRPLWAPRHRKAETVLHSFFAAFRAALLKPDIVHFHAIGPSLFTPLARLLGCRVVATHHGFDYERAKWGQTARAVLRLGERSLRHSHRVIAIAPYIRDSLCQRLGVNATVIPNGVPIAITVKPGPTCARHNLSPGKYFLFVGRFVPEKGIHILLEAYRRLEHEWALVLTGDADHADMYARNVYEHATAISGVVLTGSVSGTVLSELYTNAGAFVLPSTHEGMPIAMLEALSYGLPTIASDIPAHRSIGYGGVLFCRTNDPVSLVQAMQAVVGGASRPDRAAQEFVRNNYDWDTIALRTLEVYRQAVSC